MIDGSVSPDIASSQESPVKKSVTKKKPPPSSVKADVPVAQKKIVDPKQVARIVEDIRDAATPNHNEKADVTKPEQANLIINGLLNTVESSQQISDKFLFVKRMSELLSVASKVQGIEGYKQFRANEDMRKLGILSPLFIKNVTPRQLHEKIIGYAQKVGVPFSPEDFQEIQQRFNEFDVQKRSVVMESYAQHGLLTLNDAAAAGLLLTTSSTPGDTAKIEDLDRTGDSANQLRGYELTNSATESALFYGGNSFMTVVAERGDEDIDKAGRELTKDEVENRMRNSMLFIVKPDTLTMSRRTDNQEKEDVITGSISPEKIVYVLVDKRSEELAKQSFAGSSTQVIGVDLTNSEVYGFYNGPYTVPNYVDAAKEIVAREGNVWAHIARLPADTYPIPAA